MNGRFSEEALLNYNQLVTEKQGLDFAEGDPNSYTISFTVYGALTAT